MEKAASIKGFKRLTDQQQQLFLIVHDRHMKAMGTADQKKYALENVKKVAWDRTEKTVNVFYDDIWWHYDRKGTWY